MRGIIRGTGPAGLLAAAVTAVLAGALAAGCSAAGRPPHRATAQTCYAFGVQALERHITAPARPRACSGLSHAQVNEAVARAVREVAGARHRAVARRLAQREGRYLARLVAAVPPPRPAPLAWPAPAGAAALATPARRPADSPVSLAALAAWILTAAAGSYLLAGWLRPGGVRRRARAAGLPPVVIVSHFALAVAGLVTWIAFVAADVAVLAWIAVGLLLLIAGLGMATLVTGLPEPAAVAGTRPAPVPVIAAHGVLATATILLVLLAAIGAA